MTGDGIDDIVWNSDEILEEKAWNEGFKAASERLVDTHKRLVALEILCAGAYSGHTTPEDFRTRWEWYRALPMAGGLPGESERIEKLRGLLGTALDLVTEGAAWVEWDPDGFGDRVREWRTETKEALEDDCA